MPLNKFESNISWADGNLNIFSFFNSKHEFLMNKKFYWIMTDEKKKQHLITGDDDSRNKKFFKFRKYGL